MEDILAEGDGELRTAWLPSVDVKETDGELTFVVELPGVEEKNIQVELAGDLLTIRGEREFSKEERKEDYLRIERRYGSFQRTFPIEASTHPEEIKATFKDGLLTVVVPKKENVARQRIPVQKT
jgi:HSP20 family protein